MLRKVGIKSDPRLSPNRWLRMEKRNNDPNELRYLLALNFLEGIGSINARKLVAYCKGIEPIFKQTKAALMKIPGLGEILAEKIVKTDALAKADWELDRMQTIGIQVISYLDAAFPPRLKECPDAPILLFYKGNAPLDASKVLSIVGTRKATAEGKAFTERIVADLVAAGVELTIVSGLAFGIDVAAHRAALQHNQATIAVMGHGLNMVYPVEHREMAGKIMQNGALISDFSTQSKKSPQNFISRNRIIAGLADATLVVESAAKGGAMVTADQAFSYSRAVFAVPGRPNDFYAAGCNRLIKTQKAQLVESAHDIVHFMDWHPSSPQKASQLSLFQELEPQHLAIVELLRAENDLTIDLMGQQLNWPQHVLSPILLDMEFKGLVRSLPGKRYSLV